MAKQVINRGTTANDGTGESPFSGMGKVNDNFTELYNKDAALDSAIALKAPIASPTFTGAINTDGYTVSTLPAGAIGMRAYVTDAVAPTWNGTLTGGGTVKCPVFHNGTTWVAG